MSILMLKNVTIRFPAVGEPQSMGEGGPAWGGKFPIDPKSDLVGQIEKAMEDVAAIKWEKDAKRVLEQLKEDKRLCFERKPYRSKKTGEIYNGFEDMFTLGSRTPASKPQPTVFDEYGKPVEGNAARDQLVYDGCKVNAKVEFWAQDNDYGRRINCTLLGVMFAGEGERFGGGAAPAKADDFAEMAAEPDAESVL